MTDTVLILGAGFSFDAGVPLLSGFVQQMWDYAIRRRTPSGNLSEADVQVFAAAMKVRNELDTYHGRAMFDDRNIEDLLSMLSFNILGGKSQDRAKLKAMSRAIARTIELSCLVRHPGIQSGKGRLVSDGPDVYREFWSALFSALAKGHTLPTIITFNYDLVLERSLLQTIVGTRYSHSKALPFQRLKVLYHNELNSGARYRVKYMTYQSVRDTVEYRDGTALDEGGFTDSDAAAEIDILKLHGSVNFPQPRHRVDRSNVNLTNALDDPFILPPIFNKLTSDAPNAMWREALARLRGAKNVIFVGYSLPSTDIYMQYFLKASLGPNTDLDRVIVFDPALFADTEAGRGIKRRYGDCFAQQLRGRIVFDPRTSVPMSPRVQLGSTEHFVHVLSKAPEVLLF